MKLETNFKRAQATVFFFPFQKALSNNGKDALFASWIIVKLSFAPWGHLKGPWNHANPVTK
jgi:hypothetical protein